MIEMYEFILGRHLEIVDGDYIEEILYTSELTRVATEKTLLDIAKTLTGPSVELVEKLENKELVILHGGGNYILAKRG